MKKRFLSLILLASSMAFISCKKDDDDNNGGGGNETTETEYTQSYFDNGDFVQSQIAVKDYGLGTGTTTWSKENTYILDGFVFVNDGQTLTIEAGTVIKGKSGQGENASALIVAQGGMIDAQGSVSMPIIFTSELDETAWDTSGTLHDGDNLALTQAGLWGGVIVLGKAHITAGTETRAIEGIPTTEARGTYGGSDDADNSGTLEYVCIRHGGTNIGAGNEINGLTLGGVGTGTTIDYIEVVGNADDGVEWFGGSVNTKHLMVALCGDEGYDYDEGFNGNGQFWFSVQEDATVGSDQGGEHDGGASDNETGTPYATPVIYNATYLGSGANRLLTFRDNAGGTYANSIFYNYSDGIRIENLSSGEDSWSRYENGDLEIINNVFYQVADETAAGIMEISGTADAAAETTLTNDFTSNSNTIDVGLPIAGYSVTANNTLDPRASSTAAQANGGTEPSSWFDDVSYHGAFSSTTNWAATWSTMSKRNYFAP